MKKIILYVTSLSQVNYCLAYLRAKNGSEKYEFIFIIRSALLRDEFVNEITKFLLGFGKVIVIDQRPKSALVDISIFNRIIYKFGFITMPLLRIKPSIIFMRTKIDLLALAIATFYFRSEIFLIPDGARDFLNKQKKSTISYLFLIHFRRTKILTTGFVSNVIPMLFNRNNINIMECYLNFMKEFCSIDHRYKAIVVAHAYSDGGWEDITQETEIQHYRMLIELLTVRYDLLKTEVVFLAHPRTSMSLYDLYRQELADIAIVEDIGKVSAECHIGNKPDVVIGGLSTSLIFAKQLKDIDVFYFDWPFIPKKFDVSTHNDAIRSYHQLGINNFLEKV